MAYLIKLPKVAMSMNEGIILEWFVDVGESVQEDDPIVEFESEKATSVIEANEAGVLRRKYVDVGESVDPGTILGIVAEETADIDDLEAEIDREPVDEQGAGQPATTTSEPDQSTDGPIRASPKARKKAAEAGLDLGTVDGSGPDSAVTAADIETALADSTSGAGEPSTPAGSVRATPAARRLARDRGIDLASVDGTGPKGAVTETDLTGDSERSEPADPSPSDDVGDAPKPGVVDQESLSGMRQTIADRLSKSASEAPHVTVHREIPIEEAEQAATVLDEYVKAEATIMDVFVIAVSETLTTHPRFNATFEDGTVSIHGSQHLGIAVEVGEGLVTPVLRDVESRSLAELVEGRRRLIEAVVDGEYSPETLAGGTFTISNLGSFGIDSFTPIIDPPQVAILGVDRIRERVVEREGSFEAVSYIGVDLSFDHRVVDGADAARFLQTLVTHLQQPWPCLLERAGDQFDA